MHQFFPSADPELLKKFTKDVETVLSPTLIEELQGAQSNRSAINAVQTVPRNSGIPSIIGDRRPEIQFDNNVYPYHYERSYHYHYPPSPQDGSSGPVTYSENFYEPRFRPRTQPVDSRDPSYYRSELYNPFGSSSTKNVNSHTNSDVYKSSNHPNDNSRTDNPGAGDQGILTPNGHVSSEVVGGSTPVPPASFAPPHPNPLPNTDYGDYRHDGFGGSVGGNNHFGPGDQQNAPHGQYLPQGEERLPESFQRRPIESYRSFPSVEFHSYNEHRPLSPENSPRRSQYLPAPFLGSFFPQGYQNHFHSNYQPSEPFNNLFSENFTREFPSRPSFGGFYPNQNYLPPTTSSIPSTSLGLPPSKPEDSLPPGGPSSQPIPTTKPDDQAPLSLASNSNYEAKLFFPANNNVNHNLHPSSPEKFSLQNFK